MTHEDFGEKTLSFPSLPKLTGSINFPTSFHHLQTWSGLRVQNGSELTDLKLQLQILGSVPNDPEQARNCKLSVHQAPPN